MTQFFYDFFTDKATVISYGWPLWIAVSVLIVGAAMKLLFWMFNHG